MNTTNRHRPARCEGGATSSCTSRAIWSVRLPGDPDGGPRTATDFDDNEWIPAPAPVVLLPVGPTRRRPEYFPPTGRDYVRPERRPAAWARMAAELAADGRNLSDIAAALCVSEETATALLARTGSHAA